MDKFFEVVDKYLKSNRDFEDLKSCKILFVTRCCGVKSNLKQGSANEIYISPINQKFYSFMENKKYPYATLSDKYGLIYPKDRINNYDLSPSQLTEEDKENLTKKVIEQLGNSYDTLIFYNSSPLMSIFYLKILRKTGLKLYFISNLNILEKQIKRKLF